MTEKRIIPKGWPCSLDECPPGVFAKDGSLGFKTEYRDTHIGPEAYCLESGECWWGGTSDVAARKLQIVQPCIIEPVES